MTTTTTTTTAETVATAPATRRVVCFSFAAYAKSIITHLRLSRVPVSPGLTDAEFAAIESTHGFLFPPDLRSILREGLPLASGFPDWRSASSHHLRLLLSLPLRSSSAASSPPLVPIYRNFYLPALPSLAGNPVFHVCAAHVRLAGLDLPDFFLRDELRLNSSPPPQPPAWAAKSARRIDVWTDLAAATCGAAASAAAGGVEACLKEVGWRLREGGWDEEEVQEMLLAGGDETTAGDRMVLRDRQSVTWHVRLLALALLRAGWSTEDVVDSMGCCGGAGDGKVTWQAAAGGRSDVEISLEL